MLACPVITWVSQAADRVVRRLGTGSACGAQAFAAGSRMSGRARRTRLVGAVSEIIALCSAAMLLPAPALASGVLDTRHHASQRRLVAAHELIPISFERNEGQAGGQCDFVARGLGYGMFLTPNEVLLSLSRRTGENDAHAHAELGSPQVVRMKIVGAEPGSVPVPEEPLPGVVNYYPDNDRGHWLTGIRTYGRVRYPQIYPGIDLAYYGTQRQLEYDFVVAPQADPSVILLAFEGTDGIDVNGAGELLVDTGSGNIRLKKPVAFQNIEGRRLSVECRYVLKENARVGLALGPYDRRRELVVDPVLAYSTYFGGGQGIGDCEDFDLVADVAVDDRGQFYITGNTTSWNLPGSEDNPYCRTMQGFVTGFSSSGESIRYTTLFGNTAYCNAIAVGDDRRAYVAGSVIGSIPIEGVTQDDPPGGSHAFVAGFSPYGEIEFATYVGSSEWGTEEAYDVAVAWDAVWIVGETWADDLPMNYIGVDSTYNGAADAFVARLSHGGNVTASTYLGGSASDRATAVALDSEGNPYVVGNTESDDFPATTGAYDESYNGGTDVWVAELRKDLRTMGYCSYLGGSGADTAADVALFRAGDAVAEQIYVVGKSVAPGETGTPFPTTIGAWGQVYGGTSDAFVTRFNDLADGLVYSTLLGGSGADAAIGIGVDKYGTAYVTGTTASEDFPIHWPEEPTADESSIFISKLSPPGHWLIWSTTLGGTGFDLPMGMALDDDGSVYVVGRTLADSDFPLVDPIQESVEGGLSNSEDGFVLKMSMPEGLAITTVIPEPEVLVGEDITVNVEVTNIGTVSLSNVSCSLGVTVFSDELVDPGEEPVEDPRITREDPANNAVSTVSPGSMQTFVYRFRASEPMTLGFSGSVTGESGGNTVRATTHSGCDFVGNVELPDQQDGGADTSTQRRRTRGFLSPVAAQLADGTQPDECQAVRVIADDSGTVPDDGPPAPVAPCGGGVGMISLFSLGLLGATRLRARRRWSGFESSVASPFVGGA